MAERPLVLRLEAPAEIWLEAGASPGVAAGHRFTLVDDSRFVRARARADGPLHELFTTWGARRVSIAPGSVTAEFGGGELERVAVADVLVLLASVAAEHGRSLLSVAQRPARQGRCPFCHADLFPDDDEVVACADCGTKHHAECFAELGRCTLLGCEGEARAPVTPSRDRA